MRTRISGNRKILTRQQLGSCRNKNVHRRDVPTGRTIRKSYCVDFSTYSSINRERERDEKITLEKLAKYTNRILDTSGEKEKCIPR